MTRAESAPQSQAAIIWRQFRKRRLAVWSAGVIILLVLLSIWAPFLAYDRPLYYVGVNRFEFREAARTLRELITRLPIQSPGTSIPPDDERKQAETNSAIRLQLGLLRGQLPVEKHAWLDQWGQDVTAATTAADGAVRIRALQRSLRTEMTAAEAGLVSRAAFPVIAALSWADLFFLSWSVLLVTAPLWQPALCRWIPESRHRRQWWTLFAVWWLIPAAVALGWYFAVPFRIDRTPYKQGVLAADEKAATASVVYEQVLWPLVPYAIDESRIADKHARPALFAQKEKAVPDAAGGSPWDKPHWLGTDELGRDVLCRMLWGGRVSLSVGIVAVAIYVSIGIVVGAFAGYFRGIVDLAISRVIEVVICFPAFFLILTIVALKGPGLFNIMVIIGLTGWTGIARLIRGEFLRLVDQEFVLAGRALGYSPWRLIFRHILPNAMAPVLVSATFGVAGAILTESSLSFLGLGITVPTPSWGGILSSGRDAIFRAPWMIWFPGLAIFITITCYNLVGEALRDASDPRLRGSR